MGRVGEIIARAIRGSRPDAAESLLLAGCDDLQLLTGAAATVRDQGHPILITYSPKVFIPLTRLCRDVCHYCTFATTPRHLSHAYMRAEEVIAIARAGAAAGCHEALFTLGDKPELRYSAARRELQELGHTSTLTYLAEMAQLVFDETGLLPHLNAGVMEPDELKALRRVSVSQGLMLESSSQRLGQTGACHHGSPDKEPGVRLKTIADAGQLNIPFTSGILIGIGETRHERIESLLALRDLGDEYGHLQEIIVQNFRAKPNTVMADAPEPTLDELCWTIAVARLILGTPANIQAPPNLSPGSLGALLGAGINDWGGVSPVTPDHVNPEAPWPQLQVLEQAATEAGKQLLPRLALYPEYVVQPETWLDPGLRTAVLRRIDATGYPRTDSWAPGTLTDVPALPIRSASGYNLGSKVYRSAIIAAGGKRLDEREITNLFAARGRDQEILCAAADELRASVVGDTVSYVVTRNINYTNICGFKCRFCAFAKGGSAEALRGPAYDLPLTEIQARTIDARRRGAVEVCLQGGIHPRYTGKTYIEICRAIKAVQPDIHIHAFSPLEIWQGAHTLGVTIEDLLRELKAVGLGTLPGTAAEILDDDVRDLICPDKLRTGQWLEVMRTAHGLGLKTTSTIMFGHLEHPVHWARHLLLLRDLQEETGGFTEFVPLPFVHMEAPMYRRGNARPGPTFREAVLMHAVARLVLHPHITNIQTSWAKMGRQGALVCLRAGANDLGGTLMNESISRAAGASHGQELLPVDMEALIGSIGRTAQQRTTLYQTVGTGYDSETGVWNKPEATSRARYAAI
ncbi:MAG: 5-amino-6-(D-ribitylamino)uracil--L-tyrosine 4-hydroxyphenyl transferase CofH [Xanthomonadales bacterium]